MDILASIGKDEKKNGDGEDGEKKNEEKVSDEKKNEEGFEEVFSKKYFKKHRTDMIILGSLIVAFWLYVVIFAILYST